MAMDAEIEDDLDTWREESSYGGQKEEVEDALAFARAWTAVHEFFEEQYPDVYDSLIKTAMWFSTPNPLLGGETPMAMREAGRSTKLWIFVRDAIAENELG